MTLPEPHREYAAYFGEDVTITAILAEATVLHRGWEMDNDLWLVQMSDGTKQLLGTDHGRLCKVDMYELSEYIHNTKVSLNSLNNVRDKILDEGN